MAINANIPLQVANFGSPLSSLIQGAQTGAGLAQQKQQGQQRDEVLRQSNVDLQMKQEAARKAQLVTDADNNERTQAKQRSAYVSALQALLETPKDNRNAAKNKVAQRLNEMGVPIPPEDLQSLDTSDDNLKLLIRSLGGTVQEVSALDKAKTAKANAEAAKLNAGAQGINLDPILTQGLSPELKAKAEAVFKSAGGGNDGVKAVERIIATGTEQERRASAPQLLASRFPQASVEELAQLQATVDSAKTTESGFKSAGKLRDTQRQKKKAGEFKQSVVGILERILANDELDDVIGSREGKDASVLHPFGKIFSDQEATAIADIEEARNILTADNLDIMTGVLSETDIKIIADLAAGGLNRTRGEKEFRERVQGLIDKITGASVVNDFTDTTDDDLLSF